MGTNKVKLEMAWYLGNREQTLCYLAQENVVPVKAPPWADHPFELRRNEKTKHGELGQHMLGKETTALVIELLGIQDGRTCKQVREQIKRRRKNAGYS